MKEAFINWLFCNPFIIARKNPVSKSVIYKYIVKNNFLLATCNYSQVAY